MFTINPIRLPGSSVLTSTLRPGRRKVPAYLALALIAVFASGRVVAEVHQFVVLPDGICAGSGSAASGIGTFFLDTEKGEVTYAFTLTGVAPLASHIHGPSDNCDDSPDSPIIWAFSGLVEESGSYPLTPEQQDEMLAGMHWMNVHTNSAPRGEIRGRVVPETHAFNAKNRYLSFVPDSPGIETAWRVTLVESEQFPAAVGSSWWIGEPAEYCENGAQVNPPCSGVNGIPSSSFLSSSLQCEQHCMDWGGLEALLYVGDSNIVPGAVYEVRSIPCGCDPSEPTCYSDPQPISTSRWGDTILTCEGCPCGAPEGLINIVDIKAVLDKFVSAPCAPLKSRVDLEPAIPDRQINITDALACIKGFQGVEYDLSVPVGCD